MLFLMLWSAKSWSRIQRVSICSLWMLGIKETHIFHILKGRLPQMPSCYGIVRMSSTQTWQFCIHILVGWICLATISQYEKEGWYQSWRQICQALLSVKPALFQRVFHMVWIQQHVSWDSASHFHTVWGCQDEDAAMQKEKCKTETTHTLAHTHINTDIHLNKCARATWEN